MQSSESVRPAQLPEAQELIGRSGRIVHDGEMWFVHDISITDEVCGEWVRMNARRDHERRVLLLAPHERVIVLD